MLLTAEQPAEWPSMAQGAASWYFCASQTMHSMQSCLAQPAYVIGKSIECGPCLTFLKATTFRSLVSCMIAAFCSGHAWGPRELQPAAKRAKLVSQITPPSPAKGPGAEHTPVSQAGFKRTVAGKGQQLTLLSLEVHADCRSALWLQRFRVPDACALSSACNNPHHLSNDVSFC